MHRLKFVLCGLDNDQGLANANETKPREELLGMDFSSAFSLSMLSPTSRRPRSGERTSNLSTNGPRILYFPFSVSLRYTQLARPAEDFISAHALPTGFVEKHATTHMDLSVRSEGTRRRFQVVYFRRPLEIFTWIRNRSTDSRRQSCRRLLSLSPTTAKAGNRCRAHRGSDGPSRPQRSQR